jgi:hypothetical protein
MKCCALGVTQRRSSVLTRITTIAVLVAGVAMAGPVEAAPIDSHVVGCLAGACTAAPDGGPVAVDPLGFTLDAFWGPEVIVLDENPAGGHWNMRVLYQFTGTHTGLEHMGAITLLDAAGLPIGALNVQFDDLNPLQQANYEIFGPLDQPFSVYGFQLAPSDGSGVDTMDWVSVTFFPATAPAVPEPALALLVGLGALLVVARRLWRGRSRGPRTARVR